MSESSDIQSAVARTRETGRMQHLASEQEEMRRKRFELERTREIAERAKKVAEAESASGRRPIEDRWEEDRRRREPKDAPEAGDSRPDQEEGRARSGNDGVGEEGESMFACNQNRTAIALALALASPFAARAAEDAVPNAGRLALLTKAKRLGSLPSPWPRFHGGSLWIAVAIAGGTRRFVSRHVLRDAPIRVRPTRRARRVARDYVSRSLDPAFDSERNSRTHVEGTRGSGAA